MGYFKQFINEVVPRFSVVIEDDEKLCYAYLYEENNGIVSDVWLYNNIEPLMEVDWKNKDNLPFANPSSFVEINITPFDESTEIHVRWGDDAGKIYARIYVSDFLLAKLAKGVFPGWSTVVKKDGPIALVYET